MDAIESGPFFRCVICEVIQMGMFFQCNAKHTQCQECDVRNRHLCRICGRNTAIITEIPVPNLKGSIEALPTTPNSPNLPLLEMMEMESNAAKKPVLAELTESNLRKFNLEQNRGEKYNALDAYFAKYEPVPLQSYELSSHSCNNKCDKGMCEFWAPKPKEQ